MKLVVVIFATGLALLAVHISTSAGEDYATAISDLENKLGADQQDLKDSLAEIKGILTAEDKPDYGPKVLSVVKSVGTALPKLNSGEGLQIAQGALEIVASVAANFPGIGTGISVVSSLIASVLGLFTGAKIQKSTADIVREAVREVSDEELRGEVNGAKEILASAMDYLRPKKDTVLSVDQAQGLASILHIHTGLEVIGKVAYRIGTRKNSNVRREGEEAIKMSMLYCQLLTMRDIVYRDMVELVKKSEYPEEAESLVSVRDGRFPTYKDTLKFLTEPEGSNAAAISFYYPPGRDVQSSYIKTCLKFIGLSTDPPSVDYLTSKSYVLSTFRYPSRVNSLKWHSPWYGYIEVFEKRGPAMNSMMHSFSKTSDGFWKIRIDRKTRYACTDGTWFMTEGSDGGDRCTFIIFKLKNNGLVISPKNLGGKTLQVQGDWVGLANGNPGDQGYFKAT